MKARLQVLDHEIATDIRDGIEYICVTDIARYKNPDRTDIIIGNWLRNRNTVEFLGIWESVHNPDFNYGGFATIKSQVGLNSYKLSVKEWRRMKRSLSRLTRPAN